MPDLTAQANELKQAPDQALQQELQRPSGAVAPFLVMAEAQRRQLTRQAAQADQNQGQSGSVYDDIVRSMMARQPPQNLPAAPAGMVPMGNATQTGPGMSPQNFQAPPARMMADGGLYDEEDDDGFSSADPFLQAGSDPFLQSPDDQAQGIAALGGPDSQDADESGPDFEGQGDPFDNQDDLQQQTLAKLKGGHGGRRGRHGGGRRGRHAARATGIASAADGAAPTDDATAGGGGGHGGRHGGKGGGKGGKGAAGFKISKVLGALGKMGGASPHGGIAAIHAPHFTMLHPMRQPHPAGFHFQSGGFTGDPLLEEPEAYGPDDYSDLIADAERRHGLPPGLMHAVMHQESGGNPNAEGPPIPSGPYKGQTAKGLFQFMDDTGKHYGVHDPFDPVQSIEGAGHYLGDLFKRYGGDIQKTLGGFYGWGVHNVGPTVHDYANQVMGKMRQLTGTEKHPTAAQAAQGKTADQPVTFPAPSSADTGAEQSDQGDDLLAPISEKPGQMPPAAPVLPRYPGPAVQPVSGPPFTLQGMRSVADNAARAAAHAKWLREQNDVLFGLQRRALAPENQIRALQQPSGAPLPATPGTVALPQTPAGPPRASDMPWLSDEEAAKLRGVTPRGQEPAPRAPASVPQGMPGPMPGATLPPLRQDVAAPPVAPAPAAAIQEPPPPPPKPAPSLSAKPVGTKPGAGAPLDDPNEENMAQMVAHNEADLRSLITGRGKDVQPIRERVIRRVKEIEPGWDMKDYQTALATEKQFAKMAKIQSINAAIQHMGVLNDAIDALHNGDVTVLNRIANGIGAQIGPTGAQTFDAIRNAVAPELNKAYVAGAGSVEERRSDAQIFSPDMPPDQLRANIATRAKLLGGVMNSLVDQYKMGNKQGRRHADFFGPESIHTLNRVAPGSIRTVTSGQLQRYADQNTNGDLEKAKRLFADKKIFLLP